MISSSFAIAATLLAGFSGSAQATECTLSCGVNQTCFAKADDAIACMTSVPFNKDWATATVDVLTQSLANYGFLQLYHNTGPPYVTQLDVMKELADTQAMVDNGAFASDMDFQEHVQDFIQETQDAHTRYQKPVCYNAVFLQPFAFDMRLEATVGEAEEPRTYLMRNLYTDQYLEAFPDSPINELIGQEVTLLDNLELTTALSTWADTHETRSNNRGSRFNAAIRSYLYRSAIQYNVRPMQDLSITLASGETYSMPWLASFTTGLGDADYCAAVGSTDLQGKRLPEFPGVNRTHHPELLDPPVPLSHTVLRTSKAGPEVVREVIVPADSPNAVSCFTQTVNGDDTVQKALVMKVASFAPDSIGGFLDDVETCLNADYQLQVVDVMANGGGVVCLGIRLLELLIEEFWNDHSKTKMRYDYPHSPLMDEYIKVVNSNEGYINTATGEPYKDGAAYYYGRNVTQGGITHERTNYFSLDCGSIEKLPLRFTPKTFLPPDRLVFLTDGTGGSTTALFSKVASEAGKATLVGAGGLWEESMDVASFAGGFVANPDSMAEIAAECGQSFPKFLTNQHWQFDWAVWYSEKFPTRPAQFVVTEPDYHEAFWGFPHASISADVTTEMVSALYDRVIASSVARLKA